MTDKAKKTDKTKENQGPTCACGRGDLYEEFLKNQKEENKKEGTDQSVTDKAKKSK